MVRKTGFVIVVSAILANTPVFAEDPRNQGPLGPTHLFHRLKPAGGWNPDGGGLFHWWDPHCFDHPCAPDDYCRKPLPSPHCSPRPEVVNHAHGHPWTPTSARPFITPH
jgi:hypothetical protein